MKKVLTIVDKEWADVFKNKMVLFTVVFLPLLLTAIPLAILYFSRNASQEDLKEVEVFLRNPLFAGLSPAELLQAVMVNQFLLFFLLMPLAIPMTIAAYSVVGEKTQGTLEPLLATPITTWQLLLGKNLAASLPAVGATWFCFALLVGLSRFLVVSERVWQLILNPTWILAMGILAPLFTVLAVDIGVIISSRVDDPRAAEQLGMLVILPVLGLFFAQLAGLIFINPQIVLLFIAATLVVDLVVLYLAVQLFERETILTRWK
jgi:ABC-2 type transport system permease protein